MKTLWRFVWSSSKQVWCAVLGQVSCSLFYPDLIILSGGAGPADTRHLYCAAVATVILCYYHVTTLQWYTVTSPLPCHHLPQAGSGDPWYLGQGAGKKLNQLRWYNSSRWCRSLLTKLYQKFERPPFLQNNREMRFSYQQTQLLILVFLL